MVSEATGGVFGTAEMVLDALEVYYVLPGWHQRLREDIRDWQTVQDATRGVLGTTSVV